MPQHPPCILGVRPAIRREPKLRGGRGHQCGLPEGRRGEAGRGDELRLRLSGAELDHPIGRDDRKRSRAPEHAGALDGHDTDHALFTSFDFLGQLVGMGSG